MWPTIIKFSFVIVLDKNSKRIFYSRSDLFIKACRGVLHIYFIWYST